MLHILTCYEGQDGMKKVILLLVDSLMPHLLESCIQKKSIPALQFLKERGRYWPEFVTVFPTMTASVDSSLLTGVYPNVHRVPGIIWFHPQEQRVIDYWNGWRCAWKLGLTACTRNVLYHLNENHLSEGVTTLFEELEDRGKKTASINALVHRGRKKHRIKFPFLLNVLSGFRLNGEISGPEILTFGTLAQNNLNRAIPRYLKGWRKFCGFNDSYAVQAAKTLILSKDQPDFMLVYLPDNDHEVHKKNPDHAERSLIRVDRHIQELLNAFGSWEEAIVQCVFIIIGDHGQTRIGPNKEYTINLDHLLRPFRVLQLGEEVGDHDLVVCNNERSAYLYPLKKGKQEEMVQQLMTEERIDLIAWKKDRGVVVKQGGSRGELYFAPGGSHVDIYGSKWTIVGEPAVLDLRVHQGTIHYGDYPDALSRLFGALYSQEIPMIVITARPRYEFFCRYYPKHLNGGCHGSLHKYDSLIPLMIAGTEHPINEPPRLIDLKPFILGLFETVSPMG
ncbi:hypothetical protein DNHGIG_18580 [Collibacillus ludicampi]|uniref:Alkaline phosphatase family protein n=1 Tax=Collibacillus ludicampi TaxID=2771369 RepID=A0AAV4LF64_9BACL|nr:alkaline phosphatase family protein [Collibacillus ludicampi]GIM46309.1 hypothetical protein DNHGIG_18580 [Collibacillus ludicampi]